MSSMETLPFGKWSALRDSMKRDWPKYGYLYNHVNTLIRWQTKGILTNAKIYCMDSNAEAAVCISITRNQRFVYLFSSEESSHILQDMLDKTDQITWSESFHFGAIHESVQNMLDNFLDTEARNKGMRNYTKEMCAFYLKRKEDCLKAIVEIPEECNLKRIDEQHVPWIHSHWHYRDIEHPEETLEFLTTIARLNGGYGLFLKKDNSLVSWVLQCNRGCVAVLNTLEEHRRKSYGKIVVQALAKYIAEKDDTDVTTFVSTYNVVGVKCFENMGFQQIAAVAWYKINQ